MDRPRLHLKDVLVDPAVSPPSLGGSWHDPDVQYAPSHHPEARRFLDAFLTGMINVEDDTGKFFLAPGGNFQITPKGKVWNVRGGIGGPNVRPVGGFPEVDVTGMSPQGKWARLGFDTKQLREPVNLTPANVSVDQALIDSGYVVPHDDRSAGRRLADELKTLEYIPERDGPLGIGPIPNHIPGSATGITPLVAREEYELPRMEYPNTMGTIMDEIPRSMAPEEFHFQPTGVSSGGLIPGAIGGLAGALAGLFT